MDSDFFEDDVHTDRLSHHVCSCKQAGAMAEAWPPLSAHMPHASSRQARALWRQQGPCWGLFSHSPQATRRPPLLQGHCFPPRLSWCFPTTCQRNSNSPSSGRMNPSLSYQRAWWGEFCTLTCLRMVCGAPLHSPLWAAAHFCLWKRLIKIIAKVVFPSLLHNVSLHKSLSNRPWQENKDILTRGKITDRLLLFWLLLSSHSKWKTRKVASKWPFPPTW